MTSKRLEALRAAVMEAPPAIHVLVLAGVPRVALTPREVAVTTGIPYRRILDEIAAGRIRVIGGGREYAVPVSELPEILKWADYQDPLQLRLRKEA